MPKTEKILVPIWARVGFVIFFCLTFYFFIISPSFTKLENKSLPVINRQPVLSEMAQKILTSPITQPPPVINPPHKEPPAAETLAVSSNGVFKCVNDEKVSYTETPCKSGAVPMNRDFISISEAPSNTATVIKNNNGVYSVIGSVNSQPTEFLIDSGATNTTISGELAYRLGVHTCQIVNQTNTANGMAGNCRITVSSLSFAGFNYSNITVNLSPNMKGASLIGNDLTSKLKVMQNNGVMTISKY